MPKIAVISASPPCNINTSMLTLELAAASLQQQFTEVEFHWFTFASTPKKKLNAFVDAAKLGNIEFRLISLNFFCLYCARFLIHKNSK